MRLRAGEDGFTLIEMIVVTAIIAIVAGTLGTFFLAGASPAVAAAGRDVTAAFDEARRTASAFDAATVVFSPAASGTGYSARIYARAPGDPGFAPRNGPTYDSAVTIGETASPLGAPGFAFTVDSHGTVMGYAGFVAGATSFTSRPCPAAGAFTLHLAYDRDVRDVTIPCQLPLSNATPSQTQTLIRLHDALVVRAVFRARSPGIRRGCWQRHIQRRARSDRGRAARRSLAASLRTWCRCHRSRSSKADDGISIPADAP